MNTPSLINQVVLRFEDGFKAHRQDLSALEFTDNKYLWLGSDETATIERLTYIDAQTFGEHQQFQVKDFIELPVAEQEIDIEGLTYTEGYLWFVGSHSWKRKKPKPGKNDLKNIERLTRLESEPNRYLIGRIPLVAGELKQTYTDPNNPNQLRAAKLETTQRGNLLMDALAADPHLRAYIGAAIPGKENGFDIEGLAVYQHRFFIGLRGPVLRGWAVLLEIEFAESSTGILTLKPIGTEGQQYKKHFIDLNGLGIRDLCVDQEDLLILAGPTMDLDGPVRVYRLRDGVHLADNMLTRPEIVQEIPFGNGDDHPEGMVLLNKTPEHSLLVVYDSPAQVRLQGEADVVADVFRY